MMSKFSEKFNVQSDVDFQHRNTLNLPCQVHSYCIAQSQDELLAAIKLSKDMELPIVPIGQGSNIVLPEKLNALVISYGCSLISVLDENAFNARNQQCVDISVGAGRDWHSLVKYCIDSGWYGLENLALIPGTVGAAPIQNIGAYGREISDYIIGVQAIDIRKSEPVYLQSADCTFGYRDSVFKHYPDRWFITAVDFRLPRVDVPELGYQALAVQLSQNKVKPSAKAVFDAVVTMRQAKLPDPAVSPNVGSFFKNPILTGQEYAFLAERWPDLPAISRNDEEYLKVPAAWLIECLGWRGKRHGRAGMHVNQALVMVNYGGASRQEILALASQIQVEVQEKFGIFLELEPRISWPETA